MVCKDCARYDAEEESCRDRKVNPVHWEEAVSVSQLMGIRAICIFNDYRERLVATRLAPPSRLPGGRLPTGGAFPPARGHRTSPRTDPLNLDR